MGGQPIAGDTSGAEHPAGLILPRFLCARPQA